MDAFAFGQMVKQADMNEWLARNVGLAVPNAAELGAAYGPAFAPIMESARKAPGDANNWLAKNVGLAVPDLQTWNAHDNTVWRTGRALNRLSGGDPAYKDKSTLGILFDEKDPIVPISPGVRNAAGKVQDAWRTMFENPAPSTTPAQLETAKAAPSQSFMDYAAQRPYTSAAAALGLGGLGLYGVYNMLARRRKDKARKARHLGAPIVY